jgi:hypothetical protein
LARTGSKTAPSARKHPAQGSSQNRSGNHGVVVLTA